MHPFIFPSDLRLNTEAYIKCLEEFVLTWNDSGAAERLCLAIGLVIMPHKQENLEVAVRNVCDYTTPNIWLPNSPACNPLEHYVLSVVDQGTNKNPSKTKNELKAQITVKFNHFNKEIVGKACRRFRSCMEAIFEGNGDFFERIQFIV